MEPSAPPPLNIISRLIHSARGRNLFSVPEDALGLESGGDGDSVVERQTERLVRLSRAETAVEQVLLEILADSEELAARRVSSGVHAVGASDAAGQRG